MGDAGGCVGEGPAGSFVIGEVGAIEGDVEIAAGAANEAPLAQPAAQASFSLSAFEPPAAAPAIDTPAAAETIETSLGLPRTAFSYLRSHGDLDIEHVGFFEKLMDRLDDADDQAAVVHAARRFYRLYGDVFRGLRAPADAAREAA